MDDIVVYIINQSSNSIPEYATSGSSGMDLRANLESAIVLAPFERKMVPTGLFIELPEGFEAQVRPRSGLALKQGITCLNSPGTIDSDYRGELQVILINLSNLNQVIANGDRIAQIIFSRYQKVQFQLVEKLNESLRGNGGFGHTGVL